MNSLTPPMTGVGGLARKVATLFSCILLLGDQSIIFTSSAFSLSQPKQISLYYYYPIMNVVM